jgi:hypothetical protein
MRNSPCFGSTHDSILQLLLQIAHSTVQAHTRGGLYTQYFIFFCKNKTKKKFVGIIHVYCTCNWIRSDPNIDSLGLGAPFRGRNGKGWAYLVVLAAGEGRWKSRHLRRRRAAAAAQPSLPETERTRGARERTEGRWECVPGANWRSRTLPQGRLQTSSVRISYQRRKHAFQGDLDLDIHKCR